MYRRSFLTAASSVGLAAAGHASHAASFSEESEQGSVQTNDGIVIKPWDSSVMHGFPPDPQDLVTRENYEDSQRKLRWAVQHWRELYPTQRVYRGAEPISILPRQHRDILPWRLTDTAGEDTTVEDQIQALSMDAFIVLHRNQILCEHYLHGMRPETPHALFSINKSIVSSVIATMLDEQIQQNAPIERYIRELKESAYAGATIRQILDMESGILYRYSEADHELPAHEKSISPTAAANGVPVGDYNFLPTLEKEKTRDHGEGMRYKESDPAVLVWAAEKLTGKRFADLLSERIWGPLGCEFDLDVVCDPLGQFTYHLSCSLRDLARWGLMCLHFGRYNGKQVVPARFFRDIQQNASVERLAKSELTGELFPPGTGYRSYFYHHRANGGAIAAAGAYGQFCYMHPRSDVVIVFFSSTEPWGAQLNAGSTFKQVFAKECALERERRHLCHEIAARLG